MGGGTKFFLARCSVTALHKCSRTPLFIFSFRTNFLFFSGSLIFLIFTFIFALPFISLNVFQFIVPFSHFLFSTSSNILITFLFLIFITCLSHSNSLLFYSAFIYLLPFHLLSNIIYCIMTVNLLFHFLPWYNVL